MSKVRRCGVLDIKNIDKQLPMSATKLTRIIEAMPLEKEHTVECQSYHSPRCICGATQFNIDRKEIAQSLSSSPDICIKPGREELTKILKAVWPMCRKNELYTEDMFVDDVADKIIELLEGK